MLRSCKVCRKKYLASKKELKRGQGLHCSRKCGMITVLAKRKPAKKIKLFCSWCIKQFVRSPNHLKYSKSGLYFCTRKCKDIAQKINGLKAIQPKHFGTSSKYRLKAMRSLPNKCNRCAYDKIAQVLQVHHKDRNRSNNDLNNLEILCPTCHMSEHLRRA